MTRFSKGDIVARSLQICLITLATLAGTALSFPARADMCNYHFQNFNNGTKVANLMKESWPAIEDDTLCSPVFIFMMETNIEINERILRSAVVVESCSDEFRPGTSSAEIQSEIDELSGLLENARDPDRMDLCNETFPAAKTKYDAHLAKLQKKWKQLLKTYPTE
ncbi:MAG: hypothetical protein BGO03_07520 [Mesorhizobium sp. 61-13]|nr:MAG: hypothetical protein BGO03_07520 [Mesorhizobium sp. 61-13]